MTTTNLIKSHEECIKVLEAIAYFEARIDITKWTIEFGNMLPKLVKDGYHRIEIWQKCIERLKLRYDKLITKLK